MRNIVIALVVIAAYSDATISRPILNEQNGDVELAKLIGALVPGAPVDCLSSQSLENPHVIAGTAIVYDDGARLWVNRPVGTLNFLDDDTILVRIPATSELCRADAIHLVDRYTHLDRGFVRLGKFVPYTRRPQDH